MRDPAVWTCRLIGRPGPHRMLPPGRGVRIGACRFSWPYVVFGVVGVGIGVLTPIGWIVSALFLRFHVLTIRRANAARRCIRAKGLDPLPRPRQHTSRPAPPSPPIPPTPHVLPGGFRSITHLEPLPVSRPHDPRDGADRPLPPPGWHLDPEGTGAYRYWNGRHWTHQYADPSLMSDPLA